MITVSNCRGFGELDTYIAYRNLYLNFFKYFFLPKSKRSDRIYDLCTLPLHLLTHPHQLHKAEDLKMQKQNITELQYANE